MAWYLASYSWLRAAKFTEYMHSSIFFQVCQLGIIEADSAVMNVHET